MARQSNGIRLEAIEKRIGNLEGSIARIEGALLGETKVSIFQAHWCGNEYFLTNYYL